MPPPAQVGVVTVSRSTVGLVTELPGRTEASRVAQVRARGELQAALAEAGVPLKRITVPLSWARTLACTLPDADWLLADFEIAPAGPARWRSRVILAMLYQFFAVATEHFFDQPQGMIKAAPELYRILKEFYRQDPAKRTRSFATV